MKSVKMAATKSYLLKVILCRCLFYAIRYLSHVCFSVFLFYWLQNFIANHTNMSLKPAENVAIMQSQFAFSLQLNGVKLETIELYVGWFFG